ncbi:hypothetical protein [Flavicella sediminum]|uniref:hypothetical protein n=1 Tax=Flavicella sediminum TaxID=2585141 RepID=UPI00111F9103|nr:hypothetical protein [Flavicella sediminum]
MNNLQNKYRLKIFYLSIFLYLILSNQSKAQATEFKRTSLKTGIGVGFNQGNKESGIALLYSLGWQKSFGDKNKLRLNPNLLIGNFTSFGFTDTRSQYYRLSSLGVNIHYDLIKYKSISLVTTVGGFLNYSRGILGPDIGEWPETNNNNSEFFNSIYFGGNFSIGIRINPKNRKFAYEFRPINVQLGNDSFELMYLMVGLDIKLRK